jgi:hypothetical protein
MMYEPFDFFEDGSQCSAEVVLPNMPLRGRATSVMPLWHETHSTQRQKMFCTFAYEMFALRWIGCSLDELPTLIW